MGNYSERMKWFNEARFGMFIHWGLYSILARGEWVMLLERIAPEEYAKSAQKLNPKKFNPDTWAKLAKEAGMKYMVLTTRHHDGFCLFDSKVSDFTSVRVNFDPANLIMVTGNDPVEGVKNLAKYIVHTHAKDGVRLKSIDPRIVYNYFAEGGIEDLRLSDYFLEKPLGEGDVDFPGYIKALKDIGYNGFFTIEREAGKDPVQDIQKAVHFLRELERE